MRMCSGRSRRYLDICKRHTDTEREFCKSYVVKVSQIFTRYEIDQILPRVLQDALQFQFSSPFLVALFVFDNCNIYCIFCISQILLDTKKVDRYFSSTISIILCCHCTISSIARQCAYIDRALKNSELSIHALKLYQITTENEYASFLEILLLFCSFGKYKIFSKIASYL